MPGAGRRGSLLAGQVTALGSEGRCPFKFYLVNSLLHLPRAQVSAHVGLTHSWGFEQVAAGQGTLEAHGWPE